VDLVERQHITTLFENPASTPDSINSLPKHISFNRYRKLVERHHLLPIESCISFLTHTQKKRVLFHLFCSSAKFTTSLFVTFHLRLEINVCQLLAHWIDVMHAGRNNIANTSKLGDDALLTSRNGFVGIAAAATARKPVEKKTKKKKKKKKLSFVFLTARRNPQHRPQHT
jgi:hypothetical protein